MTTASTSDVTVIGPAPVEPKKPKKPLWRRILKWLTWTIIVVLLLVAVFVIFLHTGPGRSFVKGKIEGALQGAFDGQVSIEDLDYALLSGEVDLKGLRISEHDGTNAVHLAAVHVELDIGSLLSGPPVIEVLRLAGLDLDLDALKRVSKKPFELKGNGMTIEDLDVSGVNVRLTRPDGSKITLADVVAKGSLSTNKAAATADIAMKQLSATITSERPGLKVVVPLHTALTLKRDGDKMSVQTQPINTAAHVEREGAAPLDVPIVVGALTLDRVPELTKFGLSGIVAGPLKVAKIGGEARLGADGLPQGPQRFAIEGLEIAAETVNQLAGRDVLKSDVVAQVSVSGPPSALVLDGKVATEGGVLTLSGTVDASDPATPRYDLRLRGADIDAKKLLANPKVPDVTTGLTITVKGAGITPGAMDVALRAIIDETVVMTPRGRRTLDGLTLDATSKGSVLSLDALSLKAYGATITLSGSLDQATRRVSGRLRASPELADLVSQLRDGGVLLTPLPPLEGTVDIDLGLEAELADPAHPLSFNSPVPGMDVSKIPVKWATLSGHLDAKGVVAGGRTVDHVRMEVRDIEVRELMPKGVLALTVRGLDTGKQKVEAADITLALDGLKQDVTIAVRDAAQRLNVDVHAVSDFDLANNLITTTIDRFAAARGAASVALAKPVTLELEQPSKTAQAQTITLPRTTLAIAGGEITLGGAAHLKRDPANPEAMKLAGMNGFVDVERVNIRKLAAMARKSTRGLGGTLSGDLTVGGTPADPDVDFAFALRATTKGGGRAQIKADGTIRDRRLRADLLVTDAAKRTIARAEIAAPLVLKPKPGLAPGGRLIVDVDVPRRRLATLASLMPNGLPPTLDPEGTIQARAKLNGTPGRPQGEVEFEVEGGFLRAQGRADAPETQRLSVSLQLDPRDRKTALTGAVQAWLDASKPALVDLDVSGLFDRSPLLRTGLRAPFEITAALKPVDLSELPPQPGKPALAGAVRGGLELAVRGDDVAGKIAFSGSKIVANPTLPPADFDAEILITEAQTDIAITAQAAKTQLLAISGHLGVPGKGLRRLAKRKAKLRGSPVALTLSVPRHALDVWRKLNPKVPALPGRFGGELTVSGTLETPLATGELAYDGFTTLSGKPGRVAFPIVADETLIRAGLALGHAPDGAEAPARITVILDRAQLKAKQGMDVVLEARAARTDLLDIVPDFAMKGERLDVAGLLDWQVDGKLHVAPDEAGKPGLVADKSTLAGHLSVVDGRIAVPGTTRSFEDIRFALLTTASRLGLEIRAREPDANDVVRTLAVDGAVTLEAFKPTSATIDVKTQDFLVLGKGFDGPEAELDLAMHIDAKRLLDPIKDVEITVESVDLDHPERFVRAHYQQFTSYGDVIFLEPAGLPSGRLPGGPAPESADDDPRLASTAPADGAPVTGADVRLRIPDPIRVNFFPLDIKLQGAMDVAMRGKDITLSGGLDVVEGNLNVMGWLWELERGAVRADGGLDTAKAEIVFSRPLHKTALRDISMDADHEGKAIFLLEASKAVGLRTTFHGAGGAYLLDAATSLNTGRARYYSRPDAPASENVQFGGPSQGLVNSFIQTNLRSLIFMDRANGWSEATLARPEEYGQIQNFIAERYVADDGQRVRLFARRPTIGQNLMELQYDLLFVSEPRTVMGAGARLGSDLRLGVGLFWEFYSED